MLKQYSILRTVVNRNDDNFGTSCISCNTSAYRGKFGGNRSAVVNVVLNMYVPAVVRTVDEHSYPRASRFAGSQISNRGALCRYVYVRKNLVTVGASSLIGQTAVTTVVLFFPPAHPPLSLFPTSYASTKDNRSSLEIKKSNVGNHEDS